MSDVRTPRHRAPVPPPEPAWTLPTTPIAAGFAVLCAATALSGVVQGTLWLFYLLIAISMIVGTGILLRQLRAQPPVVALGELFVLLCLLTMSFSTNGILLILPGPAALRDLADVLGRSVTAVQTEVPPVPADAPILCLIVVAIGLVAVVVDMLAIEAKAPAASGLVLLCVYAVPASLADEMLPWWSFVLGSAAFAALLAIDGRQKHKAWRGRRSGATGSSQSQPSHEASGVVAVSIILALVVGGSFTVIGTVGRLPGGGAGGADGGPFGLKPYTKLQGLLTSQSNQELFRVNGLKDSDYLRLVTLDKYVDNEGWQVGAPISGGDQIGRRDLDTDSAVGGPVTTINIAPNQFSDQWAPVFGRPVAVTGLGSDWRWDPTAQTLWAPGAQQFGAYVERAQLTLPTQEQLRSEGVVDDTRVDSRYRAPIQVDQRVRNLINQVTGRLTTTFDKVRALTQYLNSGENGFSYSLDATPQDPNAPKLDDFLFNTRKGFCEQYASALAAMTRSMGIPTRVAIGFTPGVSVNGDATQRTITGGDAHAWVEIHFPDYGWVRFDPTPAGSRVVPPPYMSDTSPSDSNDNGPSTSGSTGPSVTTAPHASSSAAAVPADTRDDANTSVLDLSSPQVWAMALLLLVALVVSVLLGLFGGKRPDDGTRAKLKLPRWLPSQWLLPAAVVAWSLVVLALASYLSWWLSGFLAVVLIAVSPAAIRAWRRRVRLRQIAALGSEAAEAAWAEVLAESVDRGSVVSMTETVRATGRRLAREHELDEPGREALRQVITAVEGSWYGGRESVDPSLVSAVSELRASLHRTAPLAFTARVLPRSVVNRR
ncbi:transglutaminaseTgpA domain-containing protein [Kutzneria sp. NPDC052558]|uniref:transglutaminase family protein n=1 Tax=Kutzneria sp. NPDC052558 TaxID=3364121 RepID=UPI0037C890E8